MMPGKVKRKRKVYVCKKLKTILMNYATVDHFLCVLMHLV